MYASVNFKTKRAFKEAVAQGKRITIYQPNDIFGNSKGSSSYSGTASVEGPHYPAPHTWYASVTVQDGVVVKVK